MNLTDRLLEQFDKYPDPMEVEHMADLIGVSQAQYTILSGHTRRIYLMCG